MSHLKRRYCHFNASLQKKYPFIRRQKDKEDCFVFCELCSSNISIANGGLSDIRRHIASAKHQQALGGSSSNLGEGKFDPRNCSKKKKIQGKHTINRSSYESSVMLLLGKVSSFLHRVNNRRCNVPELETSEKEI